MKIIQISDLHLCADKNTILNGNNIYQNLEKIIQFISKQEDSIDLVIITGDFSEDLSVESYQHAAHLMKKLHIPVYWVQGNHDKVENLLKGFVGEPISNEKHLLFDHWQLILLNSQIVGKNEGDLAQSQLDFLQNCLSDHPNHYSIICMHHHVLETNTPWIDQQRIGKRKEFIEMIQNNSKVAAVLSGHVHFASEQTQDQITFLTCPGTSFQVLQGEKVFELDEISPGFRWVDLKTDGSMSSKIIRI